MKITAARQNINFGEKFKTEEVLSFMMGYPVTKKFDPTIRPRIIKSMTNLDIKSDSFIKNFNQRTLGIEEIIEDTCSQEIIKQNPTLKKAYESGKDIFYTTEKDPSKIDKWKKQQIKLLGKEIDLKSFEISIDDIKKDYEEFLNFLNNLNF